MRRGIGKRAGALWRALAAGLLAWLGCAVPGLAQSPTDAPYGQLAPQGPFIPADTPLYNNYSWMVGPSIELRLARDDTENREDELLYGLAIGLRYRLFEVDTRFQVSPDRGNDLQELRMFAGLSLRGVIPVRRVEWLLGAGTNIEARLQDHFYLAYVTPIEAGIVFYNRLSWSIRLLGGARILVADGAIDNVILDPNGLDEDARNDLERIRERRLEGSLSFVFARELR